MLGLGNDPRDKDRAANTPLIIAAEYGRLENIKILAKKVSDIPIDIKNRNTSAAIHIAAKNGQSDCVKYLINDLYSDANLSGRFKLTPLMLAC